MFVIKYNETKLSSIKKFTWQKTIECAKIIFYKNWFHVPKIFSIMYVLQLHFLVEIDMKQ